MKNHWARPSLLWLAAWVWAGASLANPNGPEVVQGTAGFAAAGKVLTVTNSPGAIINWQGFSVAPDETTRFIQGSAGSSVLNRVIPGGVFSPLGRVESNGQVMFMNGSVVSGAVNADLAALASFPLRLRDTWGIGALLRPLARPPIQETLQKEAVATLFGERLFVLAPQKEVLLDDCGELLVAPGRSVEIADLRWPNLRVQLTAPRHQALNLNKLIGNENSMFSAVVANSSVTSRLSDQSDTMLASAVPGAAIPYLDMSPLSEPSFIRASFSELPLPLPLEESFAMASSQQIPVDDAPATNVSEPAQLLAKDVGADQAVQISLGEAFKLAAANSPGESNVEVKAAIQLASAEIPEPPAAELPPVTIAEVQPPIQVALVETPAPPATESLAVVEAEVALPIQLALVEVPEPPAAGLPTVATAEVQPPIQMALAAAPELPADELPSMPVEQVQPVIQVALADLPKLFVPVQAVASETVVAPVPPVEPVALPRAPEPILIAAAAVVAVAPVAASRQVRSEPGAQTATAADEALVSAVAEIYADLPLTVREIWAAPKLARVERAMPRIMIDYRGAIFHL